MSDFAYYVFGQEPAVAMHLALWYVPLVCHQYDVCENSVGSVYVGGYGGLSESGLCVFCKLCPVCFLVVTMYVVLCLLPRPMGGNGSHSNFQLIGELPVPLHATGVLETLNFCSF